MVYFSQKPMKPRDELAELAAHSTAQFTGALLAYARALISPAPNKSASSTDACEERLRELLAQTLTLSELMGRRRLLLEADAIRAKSGSKAQPGYPSYYSFTAPLLRSPVVPKLTFWGAVKDILTREPRLASKFDSIWDLYRTRHAFALGKKTTLKVTKKVRDTVAEHIRTGAGEFRAGEVISKLGDWSEAYGRTVYRTNLATAYSAGHFKEAQDPDVADLVGAFEFNAVPDAMARPNHRAAHGLIAPVNDPVWSRLSPPLGFNCRCSLRLVDRFELQRKGLLRGGVVSKLTPGNFAMAGADKGFTGRADRRFI